MTPSRVRVVVYLVFTPLTFAAVSGCSTCPTPKAVDAVLPRSDPVHALGRFALYIVSEEWGDAYDRLAASNRDKLGFLDFRLGAPFVTDPVTGAPLVEIIEKSVRTRYRLDADPQRQAQQRVEITYRGNDAGTGQRVIRVIEVEMVDERAERAEQADWKVDLLSTVERLSGLRR